MPKKIFAILLLIVLAVVFIFPTVINDEGTLYKNLEHMNLYYGENGFGINHGTYNSPQNTQEGLVALLSVGNVLYPQELYLIFSIILAAALWLILKASLTEKYKKLNILMPIVLVFVFADFGYIGYFKTMYPYAMEATLFLLWLGLMLYAYRKGSAPWHLILLTAIVAAMFALAGTITAAVGIVLGLVIIGLMRIGKGKFGRCFALICGIAVMFSSIAFLSNYKDANYDINLYNSVFFGAANYKSVSELGLDPKLDNLNGKFYTDEIAKKYDLKDTFYSKMNYGKVTEFYLTHWGAAWDMTDSAACNAFFKPYDKGIFNIYGLIKSKLFPNTLPFVAGFILLCLAALIYLYVTMPEGRPIFEIFIGVAIASGMSLKLPMYLNGIFDITKNMFLFNLFFDVLLVTAIIGGSIVLLKKRDAKKEKYGITQ